MTRDDIAKAYETIGTDAYGPKKVMRIGNWMTTYTGVQFWPLDPRPEEIRLEDIAHALAQQCRFAGHTKRFYSVAEHSVRVARLVMRRMQGWDGSCVSLVMAAGACGLLHDATEEYLMDIPRPLKRTDMFAWYREHEKSFEAVIAKRFGLEWSAPVVCPNGPHHATTVAQLVAYSDQQLLVTEIRDLMAPIPAPFDPMGANVEVPMPKPLPEPIKPASAREAERMFLECADELLVEVP